ncbi:MAG TPA: ester cyclase [Nocardioidaceae bacterium]|nr:ester cyclase [Nocardioidaceae bacterium]
MEQQSSSVVARWLAAGDSGDVEAFDDFLHGDVVVHAPRGLSTDSREAEKQVWREALAAMPDLHHEVQEVLVQGNVEMARVIVTGTLRRDFAGVSGGGRSVRMDQAVICHLDGDKIAEAWEIADVGSLDESMNPRLNVN